MPAKYTYKALIQAVIHTAPKTIHYKETTHLCTMHIKITGRTWHWHVYATRCKLRSSLLQCLPQWWLKWMKG